MRAVDILERLILSLAQLGIIEPIELTVVIGKGEILKKAYHLYFEHLNTRSIVPHHINYIKLCRENHPHVDKQVVDNEINARLNCLLSQWERLRAFDPQFLVEDTLFLIAWDINYYDNLSRLRNLGVRTLLVKPGV